MLIAITASDNIELDEVEIASALVSDEAHPDATIIWGAAFSPDLKDEIRVTIIATGFSEAKKMIPEAAPALMEVPAEYAVTEEPAPAIPAVAEENPAPVYVPAESVVAPAPAPAVPKVEDDDIFGEYGDVITFIRKSKK